MEKRAHARRCSALPKELETEGAGWWRGTTGEQEWVDLMIEAKDKEQDKAKKYVADSGPMALYLVDPTTVVIGNLDPMEEFLKNGAKWDPKPAKDSDDDAKKAFKKTCIDAEAELTAAIGAFKKSFA